MSFMGVLHCAWSKSVSSHYSIYVLKRQTLVACQKSLDKQCSPKKFLTRVFHVCYFDQHFVNTSPESQHFI